MRRGSLWIRVSPPVAPPGIPLFPPPVRVAQFRVPSHIPRVQGRVVDIDLVHGLLIVGPLRRQVVLEILPIEVVRWLGGAFVCDGMLAAVERMLDGRPRGVAPLRRVIVRL